MESSRKEDFSKASAVHKGEFRNFLNLGVAKVYTLKQSATVARMPVELRQPGASSLVLACSADPRGDGSSLKVNSARLIHPWKRYCPLYPKSRQPGAKTLFRSLQSRKTLLEMPITVELSAILPSLCSNEPDA